MAEYRIKAHEVTGVKGKTFYKNQVIDGKEFVIGSIDHLKAIDAIVETQDDSKGEPEANDSKKSSKKDKKPE